MAKKDASDEVLSDEELQLAKDAMDLGEGGDDEQETETEPTPIQATSRTVTITEDQHQQILSFLTHYGINTDELSLEEAYEKYQRIQDLAEEQAQVLSRGTVLDSFDRVLRHVPKGFTGSFFHESRTDLDRAAALGWVPLKLEEANLESSTGKADGLVRVGDLVLHIIPDEANAARLIARERRHEKNRTKRKREQVQPSQGAAGLDPLDAKLGAHPDHPIRPLSDLQNRRG